MLAIARRGLYVLREGLVSAFPVGTYRCIVADPPWPVRVTGAMAGRHRGARALPYETMEVASIAALPVAGLAEEATHLWLWTTNGFLRSAFDVMESWGAKYLTTITWVKPSGYGPWFASTTQHVLFGYYGKCVFPDARYKPTHFMASPQRKHSRKPDEFYDLARAISPAPRIDLFNRRALVGFDGWGLEAAEESA